MSATKSPTQDPATRQRDLGALVWRACDIMRRDDHCGGVAEYVEHLAWLLFLKLVDERHAGMAVAQEAIAPEFRWGSWATGAQRSPDALLEFVKRELIPHLGSLRGSTTHEVIASAFRERPVVVCASGANLMEVLALIDQIELEDVADIDALAHVYESLLARLGSENRLAGEFYTPRPVVRFATEITAPQHDETIYDPACGSCGFLVEALAYTRRRSDGAGEDPVLVGREKKSLPALLGLLNLVLHGATAPIVMRGNTLAEHGSSRELPQPHVILTNPPFGGLESIAVQENFALRSTATELLFLEHVMDLLEGRRGTRAAIVLPEGMFFRSGAFRTARERLVRAFGVDLVLSLPPGTFAPYSDVKTALLVFSHPGPAEDVLFYEVAPPAGKHRFTKTRPIADSDLDGAREAWRAWKRDRRIDPVFQDRAWTLSLDELHERNYDLSPRRPDRGSSVHVETAQLASRLAANTESLARAVSSLTAAVAAADEVHRGHSG